MNSLSYDGGYACSGVLRINTASGNMTRADGRWPLVELVNQEMRTLEFFAKNPNRVLTAVEIHIGAWPPNKKMFPATVRMAISHLRKKLTRLDAGGSVKNIRGEGYKFVPPETSILQQVFAQDGLPTTEPEKTALEKFPDDALMGNAHSVQAQSFSDEPPRHKWKSGRRIRSLTAKRRRCGMPSSRRFLRIRLFGRRG